MEKIVFAKEKDYPLLGKAFRRNQEYLENNGPKELASFYVDESKFVAYSDAERLLLLKDGARVYGAAFLSHDLGAFLPFSEQEDLLEAIAYKGEALTILDYLFIDPAFCHKGKGSLLYQDIKSAYRNSTFLAFPHQDDETAIAFLHKLGFLYFGKKGQRLLLAAPYSRVGLCSKPLF